MPRLSRILPAVLLVLWLDPAAGDPRFVPRRAAWERFAVVAGEGATVRWSPIDDVPVSVRAAAGTSLPGFSVDRAAAVRSMFAGHGELFRLRAGVDDMQAGGETEHRGIHHLRMIQTYHGIPVRGGQYMVSVAGDGRLRMVGGRSVPDVDAEVNPVVTRERAIVSAAASLRLGPADHRATASLAVEPADGPDHLVWQVVLGASGRPGEWEVLVDARDGAIRGSWSRAFGASGCASVFDPSPLAPGREEDFVISDPAPGEPARLQGPNLRILHETVDEVAVDSLAGSCFDFHFDPVIQPESFDQANVYWQVDHFIREFHGGNGFPGFPSPLTVILKPFRCGDPNTGETIGHTVWLTSEGCGYKSSTRDADIIAHETQHAVNNFFGLEGGLDLSREIYATALHESFANYFSCAAQNDPVYAEYFFGPAGFANCNSNPAEYHYARRLEIGVGALQNYRVGMIWSGALWDIRTRIGPIIDRIALESLYYLPSAPSMHIAVDAVLQADRDLHQGQYQAEMIAAFAGRGLGPGVPHASIAGPSQQYAGVTETWTADVCCGVPPYRYEWSRIEEGMTVPEWLGAGPSLVLSGARNFELRLRVTDAQDHVVETSRAITVLNGTPVLSVHIVGPREVTPGIPNRWTAVVSGQGSETVTYRWYLVAGIPIRIGGDSASVTATVAGPSTLRLLVSAPNRGSAGVDIPLVLGPVASISEPPLFYPGEAVQLSATVSSGIPPYTLRWTRDGFGPEHLLGTAQTLSIIADSLDHVVYLTATSAGGLGSPPAQKALVPMRTMAIHIDGLREVDPGDRQSWVVLFQDRPTPAEVTYRWSQSCVGPDCVPFDLGNERFVTTTSHGNFDLEVSVRAGTLTSTVRKRIQVRGVPTVAIVAPDWVAPGEPVTLRAEVSGGLGPYTYRWHRDGLTGPVLGTSPTLAVRGDGRDYVVDLEVTAASGLVSDVIRHTMQSGLGPRPTPAQPSFTVDRTVVRDGGVLTFTLAGPPGSGARLRMLDVAGREVAPVFNGNLPQGMEFVVWNPSGMRSGVYLAVAQIAGQSIVRRISVVR